VAAIRGACPAGGCCLSLCCDFRIMTDFGHIGLNEVALGISVRPLRVLALPGKYLRSAGSCCHHAACAPQSLLHL